MARLSQNNPGIQQQIDKDDQQKTHCMHEWKHTKAQLKTHNYYGLYLRTNLGIQQQLNERNELTLVLNNHNLALRLLVLRTS